MDENQIAMLIGRLVMQQEMLRLQAVELQKQLEAATKPAELIGAPAADQETESSPSSP